ncbi:GGDEF domain-containing protein [Methylobacterium platani]|uniref:diguanylate cyclase n=2 Tax=Methylobacterium platani TaxID=427683 RepID=A0A179RYM1_9HYPH|nr:GGDEF domain-containing protein [Methylobacterium platani]KMO18989.1 dethiobiotin synthetase [Methylobacterium platani JCM 14648]OAS12676.1 dethiobiotin synthetase [Methylobacterium platani]
MKLDAPTLVIVTVFVTVVMGALYLLSWSQARRTRALGFLGAAQIVGAGAVTLFGLRDIVPDWLSIGLANAAMLAAFGLIWGGARSFEGRRVPAAWIAAGPLAWLAACLVPPFYASLGARVILASAVAGLYCALAARTLWHHRGEKLPSRAPAAILLASEALLIWTRIPATLALPVPPTGTPTQTAWVAILCFAALLYTVAVSVLFMALAKERLEAEQRRVADTDPLTGIANRRALAADARRALAGGPCALLLFDLDHFKRVNDTFGHAVGDAVLVGFCAAAGQVLPEGAAFGRLGGEEFACLLPGAGAADAAAVAETVRHAVAAMRPDLLPGLAVTVSIGVARGTGDFETLLGQADRALYQAKAQGRDRVVLAAPELRQVA